MNIVHLSTADCDGAGTASLRLHRNLLAGGLSSSMIVMTKRSNDPLVYPLYKQTIGSRIWNKGRHIASQFIPQHTDDKYYFRDCRYSSSRFKKVKTLITKQSLKPDIIIAHWISDYLAVESLQRLKNATGASIVWYLMDMAPFTGGCHYAWDCLGYTKQCGKCPALFSSDTEDLSHDNWNSKFEILRTMNITVVAGSTGIAEQARKSSLFGGQRIETILLGIDDDVFRPTPKDEARQLLALPSKQKIVYFGARSMQDKRKGMDYLLKALNIVFETNSELRDNILLLTSGDKGGAEFHLDGTFSQKHLGVLDNDAVLVAAYQAADVFVCPSVEDSGPMMINESILCGTPVVCFDMGVARDLVHTGVTGYRAKLKDCDDLAKGIVYILNLNTETVTRLSAQCRSLGIKLSSPSAQVKSFRALFDSLSCQEG